MISIAIDHMPESSGEPSRRVFGTPVRIGRGAECEVRLDAANRAISRVHLEVVEEAGEPVVVNRGSNPGTTRHAGRILAPEDRLDVPQAGEVVVSVLGEAIAISRAGPLRIEAIAPDGRVLGSEPLAEGRAVVLRAGPGAVFASVNPAEWTRDEASDGEIALFLDAGQPALVVLIRPKTGSVAIDNGEVATPTAYLRPLETVRFAGYRLCLWEDGHAARTCTRSACGCLTPASASQCRVCGTEFAAAEAVGAAGA